MKYIYLFTSPSGKRYVGQSTMSLKDKMKSYRDLEKNIRSNRKIANAIQKYGLDNMKFEILEEDLIYAIKHVLHNQVQLLHYLC